MAYRSQSFDPCHAPPNSLYATTSIATDELGSKKALSVMSASTSLQYAGDDDVSVRSAPPLPEAGIHLTRKDIAASLDAYDGLLKAAQIYREQMLQLAGAAAGFGYALERVARGKGASDAGQGLQAAAGLQLLISNHQQILSDMFSKALEIPLKESLEHHKNAVQQSQENYDQALKAMSKKIRETEAKNMKNGRKGKRDIRQFRKALQDLTQQVDEVDRIKTDYHQHILDIERKNYHFLLSKVATVVRAQVDIYERISNKGLADPMLEQMMHQNPDPFCAYPTTADETTEIFTVLPPISLIDPHQSPASPFVGHDDVFPDSRAVSPLFGEAASSVTALGGVGDSHLFVTDERLKPSRSETSLYNMPQKMWRNDPVEEEEEEQLEDEQRSISSHEKHRKETAVGDKQDDGSRKEVPE